MDNSRSTNIRPILIGILVILLVGAIFAATTGGCFMSCAKHRVPGGGTPVPEGARYWTQAGGLGAPVPAGQNCIADVGNTCDNPGQSCFLWVFDTCTDTVEVRDNRNWCTCRCID